MKFCSGAFGFTGLLLWIVFASELEAQQVPVHPASTHVFPAGGRRGTTVELRVGGECLPPYTRLRWFGEGLKSPEELGAKVPSRGEISLRRKPTELAINYPKEWLTAVEIAPDAPTGAHLWRLASASGGTSGRFFLVGDLPEFVETESNSQFVDAELVTLPVTINGQIDGERDLDYYHFTARAGEVVAAEVLAARLGYATETLVEFFNSQNERLASEQLHRGGDPVVAMSIPADGDYYLVVSNLNYHGGPQYVYRVTLSTAPVAKSIFPAGWQSGQSQTFDVSVLSGDGVAQELRETIVFDAGFSGTLWNPVLPSGARVGALETSPHPGLVEQEPNSAEHAMQLSGEQLQAPLVIHGRFLDSRDEDWFEFPVTAGSGLMLNCVAVPSGTTTLPMISIHDAAGVPLATHSVDDPTDRCAHIDMWAAPTDGHYRVRVRDLRYGSAGGPELTYQLTIEPAVPNFSLHMASDIINVVQGAKVDVDVRVRRAGGFNGPIRVAIENLPAGVTCDPLEIAAGQDAAKLSVTAAADARSTDVAVRIIGTSDQSGTALTRVASAPHLARDAEAISIGPLTVEHVQLTVCHKPVFKLYCNEAYQYAHRGTIYPYLMEVDRLDGFNGPIELEIADRQIKDLDGVEVLNTTIAPDSKNIMLPIYLPETMHINVQAHSNIYSQGYAVFTDQWGQRQSMLVVSTMRCMIRPLPTVARLKYVDKQLVCTRGATAMCRLQLDRTSHFTGPVTIQLISPAVDQGVAAEPVTLAANESMIDVPVHVGATSTAHVDGELVFRAVGELPDDVKMITEARVPLRVENE